MPKANADNLAKMVMGELNGYVAALPEDILEAQKVAAKAAQKELKATSPKEKRGKHPGRYAKSWKVKTTKTRMGAETVVYNTESGLPHLLEYGHDVKVGGRTVGHAKAYPHVEKAEANAMRLYAEELERRLNES